MKWAVTLVAAAFALGLAVVVGNRMSADAMALVMGVMCGVLASVPTSLLLIWALGRRGQANGAGMDSQARGGHGMQYPPVVVVNPGTGYGGPQYGPPPLMGVERSLPMPSGPRQFKVVGEEETLLDSLPRLFPGLAEEWEEEG
jgi:hypothetical protein